MAFGLIGERVRLVPIEKAKHQANFHQWLNDYEVVEGLCLNAPQMLAQSDNFFERMADDRGNVVFAIELLDGTHIGTSGIHQINQPVGTASTGSYIGEKSLWGQGYAVEANRLRSTYCFEILGLRVIYSSYIDGNSRSHRMQTKVGYLETGRRPLKYWKKDRYVDEVLMSLTRERWESLVAENFASVK